MLINFVGCPRSGKTTIAAKLFSQLKETNIVTEFVGEQARKYIVDKKFKNGILFPNTSQISLTEEDQIEIMKEQTKLQVKYIATSNPKKHIIICDSSPLNSLLYMSNETKESKIVKDLARIATQDNKPIIFYCKPIIDVPFEDDPNRIHTLEQSKEIDDKIENMLKEYTSKLKIYTLSGDLAKRNRDCFCKVIENT